MKVGLLGGSFDPAHNAHIKLARWTIENLCLDKIIFIPAAIPPHKQDAQLTAAKHRLKMLELALKKYPEMTISDIEIKRQGVSYTIDTILAIKSELGLDKNHLYLLIGADNFIDFQSWKRPNEIMENCQIAVYRRPNVKLSDVENNFESTVMLLYTPLINISSTEIRERIKQGKPINHLVPKEVDKYIQEHNLYRN